MSFDDVMLSYLDESESETPMPEPSTSSRRPLPSTLSTLLTTLSPGKWPVTRANISVLLTKFLTHSISHDTARDWCI